MTRKFTLLVALSFFGFSCFAQGVISWKDAAKYYGQEKTVEGTIVASRNTGKVCFLNFSENWKTDFTAVIFGADLSKFPPNLEAYYKGKRVRVTGKIQKDQGKPAIIVNWPRQIAVLKNK